MHLHVPPERKCQAERRFQKQVNPYLGSDSQGPVTGVARKISLMGVKKLLREEKRAALGGEGLSPRAPGGRCPRHALCTAQGGLQVPHGAVERRGLRLRLQLPTGAGRAAVPVRRHRRLRSEAVGRAVPKHLAFQSHAALRI